MQRGLVCQDPSILTAREYDRAAEKLDTASHTSDVSECFPRSAPLQMALVLHRSASDLLLRRRRLYGGSEEVQSGSAQVELSAGLRWWKRAGRRCFLKAADEFDPAYAR